MIAMIMEPNSKAIGKAIIMVGGTIRIHTAFIRVIFFWTTAWHFKGKRRACIPKSCVSEPHGPQS
jgi:hypothetical protein